MSRPLTGSWLRWEYARQPSRKARITPARRDIEHARGFRRLVKWRTGCEGRISYLKHRYGWDRTRLDGREGASIWYGHGIFARNLVKISALAR